MIMNRVTRTAALAGLGVGVVAARRVLQWTTAGRSLHQPQDRWLVLTVNRRQQEIAPHNTWPEPLAELGDAVEIELRQAPAGKGTEIAVRLRDPQSASSGVAARVAGTSSLQEIRSALRKTKQILEVGEVLKVDPQPHGRRTPTPGGLLMETAAKRAGAEGVL
jgi:hypothetical protein